MKKSTIGIILIAVLALAGVMFYVSGRQGTEQAQNSADHQGSDMQAAQSGNQESKSDAGPVSTDKVDIKDFDYQPKTITVKKGTTVTWTNQDVAKHDATPDTESSDFQASKLLAKGESYSWTFNTVGTYSYHCSPHPYMKATVVVTE